MRRTNYQRISDLCSISSVWRIAWFWCLFRVEDNMVPMSFPCGRPTTSSFLTFVPSLQVEDNVVLMHLPGGEHCSTNVFSMWRTNYQFISDLCSISTRWRIAWFWRHFQVEDNMVPTSFPCGGPTTSVFMTFVPSLPGGGQRGSDVCCRWRTTWFWCLFELKDLSSDRNCQVRWHGSDLSSSWRPGVNLSGEGSTIRQWSTNISSSWMTFWQTPNCWCLATQWTLPHRFHAA